MQRSRIGFGVEFDERARHLGNHVVRHDGQYTIQEQFFLSIAPATLVRERSFLQRSNVAGVKLDGALQISCGFFPAPLLSLDVSCQFEYPRSIWCALARKFQFSQCTVVIEMSLVEIVRTRKVRFPCVRTKTNCCLDGCFS